MSKKQYTATIQIVIEVEENTDPADLISGIFTDSLQGNGEIIDWSYTKNESGIYQYAKEVPKHLIGKYDGDGISCVLTGEPEEEMD